MPYRRGYRNRRRRPYRRRGQMSRSRRRPMTVRRVRRIVGAELKRNVFAVNGLAPAVDGFIEQMTFINQGVIATNRVGDWLDPVNMHGTVQVNGFHNVTPASGEQTIQLRVVFFTWKLDAQSGDPTVADIMDNDTSPNGHFNFTSKDQFKVLYTRHWTLIPDRDSPYFNRTLKYYIRLGGHPKVTYDGISSKQNHIFFLIYSDVASGDPAVPAFRLDNVIRYTDG